VIALHTYLLFIGAVIVLVITPGPDMAYILARTVAQGRKAGIFAAMGINVGAYVHVAASVAGLTAILASSAWAFTAVKWIGAAYLIWTGIRTIVGKSGVMTETGSTGILDNRRIFWQGFLSDVLNPKVAIFFLAFLPQFVDVHNEAIGVTGQLLLLGITSNIVAIGRSFFSPAPRPPRSGRTKKRSCGCTRPPGRFSSGSVYGYSAWIRRYGIIRIPMIRFTYAIMRS
jgi:threonine/homoserine/homoserine lactone efflux protein